MKRGDRVVLIGDAEGSTRVAYLAIQCAGAIPVCMYGIPFFVLVGCFVELTFSKLCS